MNFEQARFNMIEQQIRTWEVLDQRVLDLMAAVPREDFVPEPFRRLAFSDTQIPLGHDEVMMAPKVEARLLQSLQIGPDDTVLEIGTGSGYLTAMLANSASSVTSVDIHADFTASATAKLRRHGVKNVSLHTGDAATGWGTDLYDVIAVTGSLPELPDSIPAQLREGGRLFVVVGNAPVMEALLVVREGEQAYSRETLFETTIPPLVGAPSAEKFHF
jgi:protein-L-isoaspartate(D-aspartate) O-methyltransferase